MPKDSLKKLLKEFPYFFDKRPGSNFYKTHEVFNNRFKDIYQTLFKVYESFKLEKRLFIWKEQSEPYVYIIHFVCKFPNLKSAKIFKNQELIYSEEFEFDENISAFDYNYEYDTRFDLVDEMVDESEEEISIERVPDIIPQDEFLFEIETYDEYIIKKGFPENDTHQGNEFDHDESLDEIGVLNNCPRKEYIETLDYENTEPKFNDRLSEDDYHYMKRMLHYLVLINTVPLPVAEIWKLYGIDATMLNRERLLLKMFDIENENYTHYYDNSTDENGEYIQKGDRLFVGNWIPERNDHKDGFSKCIKTDVLFFVGANNFNPKKFSILEFYFNFLDGFAEPVHFTDFTIEIYINDVFKENCTDFTYRINTEELSEIDVNRFKFIAKDSNGKIIGEREVEIHVKGCNDGDFYVTANGNDSNDGSKEHPFATLGKAISKLSSTQNLIIIGGTVVLDDLHVVSIPCTIMGCNNGTLISYRNDNRFLNVAKDNNVTLTDLNLSHNYAISYFKSENYENNNESYSNLETVIIHGGLPVLTLTANQDNYYHLYDNVILNCNLKSLKNNPIKNTRLQLFIDDEFHSNLITNNNGDVRIVLHFENNNPLDHTFKFKFNETDVFWENTVEQLVNFRKTTPRINRLYGRLLTLNTEYSDHVDLYENGIMRKSASIENSCVYLPDYGEHIVYFSEDGIHVVEECVINSRFYISDLNVPSLVTDVEITNEGDLIVTKTPLSEFTKLQDLEDVLVDLSLENNRLYKASFVASNLDGLNGNEIYPEDLVNMQQAIVNVTLDNEGKLELERISTIVIEEEP